MNRIGPRGARALLQALCMACACVGPSEAHVPGAVASADDVFDCGTSSLLILMRLEGRNVDPEALISLFPAVPRGGYSLKELASGAARSGFGLQGVRLASDAPPDRPVIAYLNDGVRGHYVVVRPVGLSDSLVQVLDLTRTPEVVTASDLCKRPEWTGLVLLPVRSLRTISFLLASVILVAALILAVIVGAK